MSLAEVSVSGMTLRGVSLGGVYTSLYCPQLKMGFDAGIPLRAMAGLDTLLLSHAHADHAGALPALLGMRGLTGIPRPLRVIAPSAVVPTLRRGLDAFAELQRFPLDVEFVGLADGESAQLRPDLSIVAHKAFHPVPCLAYRVVRHIRKLRPEFAGLTGPDIARRKQTEDLFYNEERTELAYVTDTLVDILDAQPALLTARILVIECTFYDARKSRADARAGCHIHWDELEPRLSQFTGENIVLMHTSQLYERSEVNALLDRALPPARRARVHLLMAEQWPT